MSLSWKAPQSGEFVWCHFPELPDTVPGPKPRPALVLDVIERDDGVVVVVVPGTSQRVTALSRGEVAIMRRASPEAYALAGLSFDTKFDMKVRLTLPWSDRYFKVPPAAPHGQHPKLGTLHPSLVRSFGAAFSAATP